MSSKFPNIDFSKAFSNVTNKHIDPLALDVTFKMCHNVLPVAYRLHRFGINIDKMCSFCKKDIETVDHLFFYCIKVQKCKRILASCFLDIGEIGISPNTVMFSVFEKIFPSHILNTLIVILSEYRSTIWKCRNKTRYDKNTHHEMDLANCFINKLKFRITVDFHRFCLYDFSLLWCHNSICTIENGKIDFKFSRN